MISDFIKWEDLNITFDSTNNIWDEVILSHSGCIIWNNFNSKWDNSNYTWDEVCLLIEIEKEVRRSGNGDYSEYFKGNPWGKLRETIGEDKTKKVVSIYLKYKNIEYNKSVDKFNNLKLSVDNIKFSNKSSDIKVTATDIEIFIKDVIKESISIKVSF